MKKVCESHHGGSQGGLGKSWYVGCSVGSSSGPEQSMSAAAAAAASNSADTTEDTQVHTST